MRSDPTGPRAVLEPPLFAAVLPERAWQRILPVFPSDVAGEVLSPQVAYEELGHAEVAGLWGLSEAVTDVEKVGLP